MEDKCSTPHSYEKTQLLYPMTLPRSLQQQRKLRVSVAPPTAEDLNSDGNTSPEEEEEEEEEDLTGDPSTSQPPGQDQLPSGMHILSLMIRFDMTVA